MAKLVNLLLVLFVLDAFSLIGPKEVKALTPPEFPACSNPQGTLKVKYDSGTHGIVGETGTFTGSDSVYDVDEDQTLQCFCSENGDGTQTNWWKISSLTQDEIDTLKVLGWFFVPSGAPWGLSSDPYMAFNSTYACRGGNGVVLAQSTSTGSVLGLASTGNIVYLLVLALAGLLSLITGIFLRKISKYLN